jgi:hypothetical protein
MKPPSRPARWTWAFTFIVAGAAAPATAAAEPIPTLEQIKTPAELSRAIAALDKALFDSFNHCEMKTFASYFSDDVEFYHDRDGLSLGKKDLVDAVKKNICGKVSRELVPGSLEAYPIKDWGAVEIGVHRFHHPGHDDTEPVGEGRFIHLWRFKDGAWQLTRVISFDHHAVPKR